MRLRNTLLLFAVFLSCLFFSCTTENHTVSPIKAYSRKTLPAPPGMAYVPGGSIIIRYGQNALDSSSYKKMSLSSFFMDKTEVTNRQYREFIDWVIDSVAVTAYLKDDRYFKKGHRDSTNKEINWKAVNKHKGIFRSKSKDVQSKLAPMYAHQNDIKKDLYNYKYEHLKTGNNEQREDTYVTEVVNVYPNTKTWGTDFPNSQTDIMVQEYFKNPAFDDYPVVGVTWKQAMAYASWKNKSKRTYRRGGQYMKQFQLPYTLPSEAQWAYAAQGKHDITIRNASDTARAVRDSKSKLIENFKQEEGDYTEDGSSYTVPVTSYHPNEFGIYNMEGNVSEWVQDAYNESAWAFVHDQNPVLLYDADSTESDFMKRKVVRGGSWKDNARYLSPYTRNYEVQDIPHSYIGFRLAMPAPEIITKQVETKKKRISFSKYNQ